MKAASDYGAIDIESQVFSASPAELVVLLYKKMITLAAQAAIHIENRSFEEKARATDRLMDILAVLSDCVDTNIGDGSLGRELRQLYRFLSTEVLSASTKLDAERMRKVETALRTVASAWEEIASAPPSSEELARVARQNATG